MEDKQNLAKTHPQLAKEWHPEKNGSLSPEMVTAGSNKKVWWKCPKGDDHEWTAKVSNRTRGNNCPVCSGRMVTQRTSLAALYPELAKEWHPTKNNGLHPDKVRSGSHTKVWWKCPKGDDHEWESTISNRSNGNGCPACSARKVVKSNSLATQNPALASEWHPTKNKDHTPASVVSGGHQKVWWKCPKGDDHEWEATIYNRVAGNGCPACRGVKLVSSNSLAVKKRELAKEWHPTRNGQLTPDDVLGGGELKVWWKCPKGDDHEWYARIDHRANGSGCPVCAGQKVVKSNSLAVQNPVLAEAWHPTLNGSLTPSDVLSGGNEKFWWKCSKGDDHEWRASVGSRIAGRGCSVCAGKKLVRSNSLEVRNPHLAKEWHPTRNGNVTPSEVISGAARKAWWKCPKGDDHEWESTIHSRVRGSGCPACRGLKVVKSNSLATLNPNLAKEWHPTKNGGLMPSGVLNGGHKKVWWKCPKGDDHEWESTISNRVNGTGCSICSGRKLVASNSLAARNPDVANEWHPTKNGDLTPWDVYSGMPKKVWWKCPERDDHGWESRGYKLFCVNGH